MCIGRRYGRVDLRMVLPGERPYLRPFFMRSACCLGRIAYRNCFLRFCACTLQWEVSPRTSRLPGGCQAGWNWHNGVMETISGFSDEHYWPVFASLAERAAEVDRTGLWPAESLRDLAQAGFLAWGIPEQSGGRGTASGDLVRMYLDAAAGCLNTTFILSQRNGAVARIVAAESSEWAHSLLPQLARGELFATVGISHLSTSRQHLASPPVSLRESDSGYVLNGLVPWVTGVAETDLLVTGGSFPDGRQMLVLLEADGPGVTRGPTAEMLALSASGTGNVYLEDVEVPRAAALTVPREQVMKSGGGGTGSLTTSMLALGVAMRALRGLLHEAEFREELQADVRALRQEWQELIDTLLQAETTPEICPPGVTQTLRTRANSLVLRAAQAYLTACKGTGFVKGHPAERTFREASFFLVWSCPLPVQQAALREFACTPFT